MSAPNNNANENAKGLRDSYLRDEGRGFNSTSGAFTSSDEGLLSSYNDSTLARESKIGVEASSS